MPLSETGDYQESFMIPTWKIGLRVWWTICWQGMLGGGIAGGLGGFIGGVIGGFLGAILGLDPGELGGQLGGILGFLGGIAVSIWVIKNILSAEYKDFKIVLLCKSATQKEPRL